MKLFLKIAKKTFGIFIVPIFFSAVTIFLHLNVEQSLFTWSISKIFVVLTIVLHLFAFPALLYSLRNDFSIIESYKRTKKIILSLIFVTLLYFIFFWGGTTFLIIPGIIFSILFSLSFFVVIFENIKGWSALWRSREIVKGKEWYIFGLFLFIGVIFILLQVFVRLILEEISLGYLYFNFYLISLFHYIVLWIILFNFYEDRKEKAQLSSGPRGIKKIFLIVPMILGSVFFLIYSIFVFSFLFRDYDPYFDDRHLLMEEKEVIEEGNLHFFLMGRGYDRIIIEDPRKYVGDLNYHDFIKENPKKTREIIENNKEIYEYFQKMVEHTHYTTPLDYIFSIGIDPGKLLTISHVISFKTSYLLINGQTEEGMNLFLDNLYIGYLLTDNVHQERIDLLVGLGYQEAVYKNIFPVIDLFSFSDIELKNYQKRLELLEPKKESFSRAFSREYTLVTNILDHGFSDGLALERLGDVNNLANQATFLYKPNETKKVLAEIYEPAIEMKKEKFMTIEKMWSYIIRGEKEYIIEFLKGNIVGKILNNSLIPAHIPSIDTMNNVVLENRMLRIILALNAYKEEEGDFPKDLKQLIPNHLSEVPKDPFNRETYYSKEERIIYLEGIENANEEKYYYKFE
jgi:hypothetical protein